MTPCLNSSSVGFKTVPKTRCAHLAARRREMILSLPELTVESGLLAREDLLEGIEAWMHQRLGPGSEISLSV